MAYTYRKSERLRKNREFTSTMKGKRLSVDGLSLFYARNAAGNFRVGIAVGKKLANAVKRNRLRRQIRDCAMKLLDGQYQGYDLVFVARQGLYGADYKTIWQTIESVLHRTAIRTHKAEGGTS
jgi:ribonuclease P protein component